MRIPWLRPFAVATQISSPWKSTRFGVATRSCVLVTQSLFVVDEDLGLAIRIVVFFPSLGLDVVLQHSSAPHLEVHFGGHSARRVGPDSVPRRVALVEQAPRA